MYGLLDGVAGPPPTPSAHAVLRELMCSLGASGLLAAAAHPCLLASVDQHAAAVRDGIATDHGPGDALADSLDGVPDDDGLDSALGAVPGWDADPGPVSLAALAGYAEGVRETAVAHGWRPPAGPVDWATETGGDWVLNRLLAVCALARPLGVEPPPVQPIRPEPEHETPPAAG